MKPDKIFSNADKRRDAGVSNESQAISMGVDVLSTIEDARNSNQNLPGEAVAIKILFDMFERYK